MYRVLQRTLCTSTEPATRNIKSISQDLFNEVNLKNVVEKFKKASDVDRFRKKSGIYEVTVRRLAGAKRFRWIRDIIEHQKNYSDISREGFSARLISLYGKAGMYRHAHKLFDELPQRNCERTVLSLNALLAAYVHSMKHGSVERLFRDLPNQLKIEPDLVSYNTFIKALCEMGSFDSALSVLKEMEDKGVNPDLITFNTLLDGLYSKGRFEDGEKLWGQMGAKNVVPNVRSYCSRLVGLAEEKKTGEAVEFFKEMEKEGHKPDVICINAMIKGFVNEGNLDEAKKWFGEIAKYDCDPHKATFAILLPFLCEKGDLKTAIEMCKERFNNRRLVAASLLQLVVDKLVSESMISEAKEIVELGRTNRYCRYKLNLPADE
ncbi:pentatricopeptide repeat-containing protein At1g55890, mitochondrial-like [Abrus precatorius]|uniref:Pentatricopeptide repeat-containing protein At1g55890, mitochondrial-like n=1 Tax=Abrus precatorius TaxID=3816 RepID=A0A8B8KTY5_ABRPR|nr:pentatricopeptide repeat-containing protein At1g55890, mitochondrial-like [Abrus precatorius]